MSVQVQQQAPDFKATAVVGKEFKEIASKGRRTGPG